MTDGAPRLALAMVQAVVVTAAGASGCGETRFIDPNAAARAALAFGEVEHLVIDGDARLYLHVRIASRALPDDLSLSIAGPWGLSQVPLADAHRQACGRGQTCLSVSGPPAPGSAVDAVVLEAPSLNHRAEGEVETVRLSTDYVVSAIPGDRNEVVTVDVGDPIRAHYAETEPVERFDDDGRVVSEGSTVLFPRTFDARVEPGDCGQVDGPWTTLDALPASAPAEFDDRDPPEACLFVRPTLPREGPPVHRRVLTARAVLTTYQHVYTPAEEVAPLVFVPLFDLEIPSEERCQQAQDLVQSALIQQATAIATDRARPTEVLAVEPEVIATRDGVPCRQGQIRAIDPFGVVSRVLTAVDEAFGPERWVRVVWVYTNNLNLPLPSALTGSLDQLRQAMALQPRRRDYMLAIVPEPLAEALPLDERLDWVSTEEPLFRDAIQAALTALWPFRTMLHSDETIVSLLPEGESTDVDLYRICSTNRSQLRPVQPLLTGLAVRPGAPDIPAYRVALPPLVLAPPAEYALPSVVVEWQGCEALCDQPAPGLEDPTPWWLLPACP